MAHSRRFLGLLAAVAAVSLTFAACGNEADCTQYAANACEQMTSCNPRQFWGWYGDVNTCVRQEALWCEQTVSAPGSRTTADDMNACAHDLACEPVTRSCALPRGSKGDGASCRMGVECASGICAPNVRAGCSTCHSRAGEGGACDDPYGCEDGLYCDAGTCRRKLSVGSACSGYDACASGVVCIDGQCAKRPMPGDACSVGADCYNWPCVDGTCRSSLEGLTRDDFAVVGQSCALGMRCLAGSCDYCGICEPPRSSVCLALPSLGEDCLSGEVDDVYRSDPLCMPPAVCSRDFKCVLPNDLACDS